MRPVQRARSRRGDWRETSGWESHPNTPVVAAAGTGHQAGSPFTVSLPRLPSLSDMEGA